MRHCQPCPSLLSLPKSPLPKRGAPVRTLSTLLRAQDWCHVSLLGPPATMGCAEPGPLWSQSPAWSCPNAWGGAWCLGLPCASLLLAGVTFGELPALSCCAWGALTSTSKLLLMTETQVEGIHVFVRYLFGNSRSWKQFNMQWSQWKITPIILLEYQGYILLVQSRPGNKCHFLTKPLEHPWSQRSTKTWVKTM